MTGGKGDGPTSGTGVNQNGSITTAGQEPEAGAGAQTDQPAAGPLSWGWTSNGMTMTPDGQVENIVAIGHRHPAPVPAGTASAEAAITWAAVGKLGLVTGSMIPGPVGTAFSTGLAVVQWQSGDKSGALVTLGLGALNLVGVDAAAGRVILGMKETQAAATAARGVAAEGRAAATASDTWQTYEKGSVGAAQPSLPEGYSWVKNAEGDLGIKTPEGKVVSDSQGKRDIISDAGNESSANGSDKKTIIDSKGNALVGDWSATQKLTAPENALSHWIKHSSEFPEYSNASQYAEGAQTFVSKPPSNVLIKTRANGDTLLYDPLSNTFAVKTVDGNPRTMFRPADGINYWRKQ